MSVVGEAGPPNLSIPPDPAGAQPRGGHGQRFNAARFLRKLLGLRRRPNAQQMQRLVRAEHRGLEVAIVCRTLVFAVALVWYVGSLLVSGSAPRLYGIAALAALTGLGVLHYFVIGTRMDRPWLKFVTVLIDMAAVCALFAFVPLSAGADIPQMYAFRSAPIPALFPFIALAALSLSPRLTLWAGVCAASCWLAAWRYVALGMENPVSWSDMPRDPTREQYDAIFLSPDFIGSGSRYTEAIIIILVAAILAVAVARARQVFFAQVEAEVRGERERARRAEITERLGRFVPAAVAERLIKDPSGLTPQVRDGAALVMDVEGFTAFAEGKDPAEVISTLNAFLSRCAEAVSERHGVVIAFTGDGLFATFNTPLEVDAPEHAAIQAAKSLVACGKAHGFRLRVGIAAGPLAAGSVGSSDRQAFTVYGNTVNRAARLEALAKDLRETILADRICAKAGLRRGEALDEVGAFKLPGLSDAVAVWRVGDNRSAQAAPG